ncbi:unnamed protein product, partial [Medioppia subpectinata]
SAKERVKKLEEELFRIKKASDDSESQMSRAYRRRLMESEAGRERMDRLERDREELAFPMSRKTQTKAPDLQHQYPLKLISRSTQTNEVSNSDVSVNTEIDFRLMSALLDKLLTVKTSVAVQTNWKSDVIETRDASVSTDRIFRERFSPLPNTRSMSAQTEVSSLRYKDESVATDPQITGHRHRTRSLREPIAVRLSSGVQTDQKWISRKDVACEANFSSFSSESEDSAVVSAYPKGFHPKTGQLLDQSLLANYYRPSDPNAAKPTATGLGRGRADQSVYNTYRPSKTPEPIIEEYGTSPTTTSSDSSNSEGDYSCENVREIYREKYSEYKSASKPVQKSYYHMRSEEKKINFDFNDRKKHSKDRQQVLETSLQDYDREPHRPELRHKLTADKRPESRHDIHRGPEPPAPPITTPASKPLPITRSIETQTNGELTVTSTTTEPQLPSKPVMKVAPKDLKTESKITVEVTKAHKKERSEVTSLTKLDETSGKMSRTTHVTTSQHIPTAQTLPNTPQTMRRLTDGGYKPSSQSAHKPLSSPIRKAQSEIDVTPVSGVSTRPASADDLSMPSPATTPQIPTTMSYGSSLHSLKSSLKSPSPTFPRYDSTDEITVPKVGRVSIQDPMHMVLIAPPDSFNNSKSLAMNGKHTASLFMPLDKSKWRETSSSTICNEMTTDAFKDDDGVIQKPKSISMSTETLIESKGSESSVKTRSRTARQYGNEAQEKAITNETAFAGPAADTQGLFAATPDLVVTGGDTRGYARVSEPRAGMKNSFPYIESEPTHRAYSPPHRTSSSPVVTLVDTPEFLSPEPDQSPKMMSTKMSRVERESSSTPSLVTDVRASRFRPDEDLTKRLVHNTSRKAAVVEPHVQRVQPAKSDTTAATAGRVSTGQPVLVLNVRPSLRSPPPPCTISSSIAFDNPSSQSRGVIIKEINEDGTSKDGSTDTLDTKSGEIMTETNFQRFKSPQRGVNGADETSWKYSMECNYLNGTNTTVRKYLRTKTIKL